MLGVLQGSLTEAIHNVFWVGTVLSGLALLSAFWLPRTGEESYDAPTEDACCAETGERMVMAELATLDPENEPVAARGS